MWILKWSERLEKVKLIHHLEEQNFIYKRKVENKISLTSSLIILNFSSIIQRRMRHMGRFWRSLFIAR